MELKIRTLDFIATLHPFKCTRARARAPAWRSARAAAAAAAGEGEGGPVAASRAVSQAAYLQDKLNKQVIGSYCFRWWLELLNILLFLSWDYARHYIPCWFPPLLNSTKILFLYWISETMNTSMVWRHQDTEQIFVLMHTFVLDWTSCVSARRSPATPCTMWRHCSLTMT